MEHLDKPDFKAEVHAAEMALHGVPEDAIVIKAQGTLHRGKRSDVLEYKVEEDELDYREEKHIITSSREGLYDMLPQGLFHQPAPPRNANEREVIDYIKRHRIEEKAAREFFLPFETAIHHGRIKNTISYLTAFKSNTDTDFYQSLETYWPILQWMDVRQKSLFMKLLPVWHRLRGNLSSVKEVINDFLRLPVDIYLTRMQMSKNEGTLLEGNKFGGTLGLDFSIGDSKVTAYEEAVCIEIGLQSYVHIAPFEKRASKAAKLLESLCDYLLPVHLEQVWTYQVDKQNSELALFGKDAKEELMLGVNTVLP